MSVSGVNSKHPPYDGLFEKYFHRRADLADRLVQEGSRLEAITIATASIDALATIWLHDFPDEQQNMNREFAEGKMPASVRMTRFLKRFASDDEDVQKVAVVSFAEDWKLHAPTHSQAADRLLQPRISKKRGELPRSYLDIPIAGLLVEAPEIGANANVLKMAEDYEYGALLYSFYRCPLVHHASSSRRTHGFTRDTEVMYMRLQPGRTSISFGPALVTRWLRTAATGYTLACAAASVKPADNFQPGRDQEDRLAKRWARLFPK